MLRQFLILFFITLSCNLYAQDFVNGDLDGPVVGTGWLPTSWQAVDYADPNCLATSGGQASPDLTNQSSQFYPGIPYSGNTFVSGLMAMSNAANVWQEGIQQTVSGFCPGCRYNVNFFQSVVKQNNALDPTGEWAVYIDNTLAGYSTPTISSAGRTLSLLWELKSVGFVATSTTHTIKFLPHDDDNDWSLSPTSLTGAIRMGIDSIFITPVFILPIRLISFSASIIHEFVKLNWSTETEINNDYFTIEKSVDENTWTEVTRIKGAGNSSSRLDYETSDPNPFEGISYYRIKQTDYDGEFSYSKTESIFLKDRNDIRIFPNPAMNYFIVKSDEPDRLQFKMFDSHTELKLNYTYSNEEYFFDITHIKAGIYFLIVERDGVLLKKEKFVIQ